MATGREIYEDEAGRGALIEALEYRTLNELKNRARLFPGKSPTRKAGLAEHLASQLDGPKLREFWEDLDDTSKKAVAEAVHSEHGILDRTQFRAKYDGVPSWETASS